MYQYLIEYKSIFNDDTILPFNNRMQLTGKAIERNHIYRPGRKFISNSNSNPFLNSHEYVVWYPDGTKYTLTYGKLVENIYINLDDTNIHI